MNRYHSNFSMQDFFCNKKLEGIIPQLEVKRSDKKGIKQREIFVQCQAVLNSALSGVIEGNKILVSHKSNSKVKAVLNAYKPILEKMFSSIEEVLSGIKANKKLYVSAPNLSAVSGFKTSEAKLKVFTEILENIRYNPDFCGEYKRSTLQEEWKKKVNYKEKKQNGKS